jgi:signal peptidase I
MDRPPDPTSDPGMPAHGLSRAVDEIGLWLKALLSAAVYAVVVVTFVGQVARVDGYSMLPTLHDADRLIVNKLAYRWHDPQVGDIVMVRSPDEPETMLVKRVVAAPGDVVRSEAGQIFRNGQPTSENFVPGAFRSHDNWGPMVVPRGYYFVMGDHRNDSLDSRTFGPVPEKYILGKVQIRWWPLDDGRIF